MWRRISGELGLGEGREERRKRQLTGDVGDDEARRVEPVDVADVDVGVGGLDDAGLRDEGESARRSMCASAPPSTD